MRFSGVQIDTPTRADWAAVWAECPNATFFQSPTWAELWERFSDGKIESVPERATFDDGVQAILPLCFEHRLGGVLSRYVMSPSGTFGGWITNGSLELKHARLLLDHLLDRGGASLVWRMNPYDDLAFRAGRARGLRCKLDETHVLTLDGDASLLLTKFQNGYRSDIKKSLKQGHISVEPATTLNEWRAYYRVYRETLARWGHEPDEGYPWRLFEILAELRSPDVKLWLGRYDGAIVSGELCMYAKRHVVSWHAATLKDYLRSHVAKVQIYHVLQDACARGYRFFDFNPSAGLDGVRAFKQSFGAKPLPAPLIYVDSQLKRWARGLASRVDVPYAQLSLEPLPDAAQVESNAPAAGRALRAAPLKDSPRRPSQHPSQG